MSQHSDCAKHKKAFTEQNSICSLMAPPNRYSGHSKREYNGRYANIFPY